MINKELETIKLELEKIEISLKKQRETYRFILTILRLFLSFGIFLTIVLAHNAPTVLKEVIIATTVTHITGEGIASHMTIKKNEH